METGKHDFTLSIYGSDQSEAYAKNVFVSKERIIGQQLLRTIAGTSTSANCL